MTSNANLVRRRRKKISDMDVHSKLKRYEQLLKNHGIKLEEDGETSPTTKELSDQRYNWGERATVGLNVPRAPGTAPGTLFIHKEESHYVEK